MGQYYHLHFTDRETAVDKQNELYEVKLVYRKAGTIPGLLVSRSISLTMLQDKNQLYWEGGDGRTGHCLAELIPILL